MLDAFEKAAHFTMDASLREVLLNCSMGVFPSQFSIVDNRIVAKTGEYQIPSDPMDITNLIHDIMSSKLKKSVVVSTPSTRTRNAGFHMDELYMFSRREADRLHRDDEHADKIWGCIYSSIYLAEITAGDLIYKDGVLVGIRKIDTTVPCLVV